MLNYSSKPNYGLDAPGIIRNFLFIGTVVEIGSWFLPPFSLFGTNFSGGLVLYGVSLVPMALGLSMFTYGTREKFNIRDRMLDLIEWQGDEIVLDVGTGRGLLMIGAAKRLTTGKAIGVDIWNVEDLTGNAIENTLKNVELEGVRAKVEIISEDVRHMSFADASFNVVLSLLCLHNIDGETERAIACREIARVLKPGGTALLADYTKTAEYAKALAQAGLSVEKPKSYVLDAYGLMWLVVATKVKRME